MDEPADGQAVPFSGVPLAPGHVAIVEIDSSGTIWVIEAMPRSKEATGEYPIAGVGRLKYDDWLRWRDGQSIWHARVKETQAEQRAEITKRAGDYLGRPYRMLNFRLDDATSFYCSKLVWLAVMKALKRPIDDIESALRVFPLSPKQILNANTVERLHEPGDYWRN